MSILQKYSMPAACGLVGLFVALRDMMGLSVSKYLFLLICVVALVLMKPEHITLFLFFLLPMYAGLPGNYITVVFIARLAICLFHESNGRTLSFPTVIFAILFFVYLLWQNIAMAYASAYPYALCAEIVLLVLLGARKDAFSARNALTLYALGTILAGFSALAVYAREYALSDILTGAVRFGDMYGEGGMRMTLDPNFLGFLCLAAIALEVAYLRLDFSRNVMKWETFISVILLLPLAFLGLIGLSRTFFVCICLLIVCELALSAKKPIGLFGGLLSLCLLFFLAWLFVSAHFSALAETLISRFSWESVRNLGGRLSLLVNGASAWCSSVWTFLFGVGLFETNVHVTAIQYVFGLGLLGAFPALGFFVSWTKDFAISLRRVWVPLLVVGVMSCAVPAAASLSAFFPLVAVVMITSDLSKA